MTEKVPVSQKFLLTIAEASRYSNISERRIREILKEPDCDFLIRKGTHSLIKRARFEKYLLERDFI